MAGFPTVNLEFMLTGDTHPGNANAWPSEFGGSSATIVGTAVPGFAASQNNQKILAFSNHAYYRAPISSVEEYTMGAVFLSNSSVAEVTLYDRDGSGDYPRRFCSFYSTSTVAGQARVYGGGTYNGTNFVIPDKNRFHIMVWRVKAGTMQVYLDGVLLREDPFTPASVVANTVQRIGTNYYDGGDRRLRAQIGALFSWRRQLSDAELSDTFAYFADRYAIQVDTRQFAGTASSSGTLAKSAAKRFTGVAQPVGTFVRTVSKRFAGSSASTGSLIRSAVKGFAGAATPTGFITKSISRKSSESLDLAGTLVRSFSKRLTGSSALAGSVLRSATKLRRGTVALFSVMTATVTKKLGGSTSLVGNSHLRVISPEVRNVCAVELFQLGWSSFLDSRGWKAELDQSSGWKLSVEGAPVIAGSVEEIKIGVLYSLNDVKPMPTVAQVQIGDSPWEVCEVTQLSQTRALIRVLTGPLARGTYPIHVKFNSGDETPILYAGSLAVV